MDVVRDLNNPEFYKTPMTVPKTVAQDFLNFANADEQKQQSAGMFWQAFEKAIPDKKLDE
jgi:hypothetical protein